MAGYLWQQVSPSFLAAPTLSGKPIPEEVREILSEPDEFELLSIEPHPKDVEPKDDFHGHKILGKIPIRDRQTQKTLFESLTKGVSEGDMSAGCHNPRHAIRAARQGKRVEVSICFECWNVYYYCDGVKHSGPTSNSPQAVFDKTLADAGIPLAKKRK